VVPSRPAAPTVYVGSHDDSLYAVDTATGTPEWISDTVDDVFGSVRGACALR
jgi:outer membrane protein assembly factor BamB